MFEWIVGVGLGLFFACVCAVVLWWIDDCSPTY